MRYLVVLVALLAACTNPTEPFPSRSKVVARDHRLEPASASATIAP